MSTQNQVDDITPLLLPALRNYRRGNLEAVGRLGDLALVQQKLQQDESSANVQSRHWALCRVLEEGVNQLGEQEAELAEILRLRFFQGRSVAAVAHQFTLSESGFFYRQKRAIHRLADLLLTAESELKQPGNQPQPSYSLPSVTASPARRLDNLPPATYSKIFGLEQPQQRLQDALNSPAAPWLITLVGMGGIGKSTLAHLGSRWAMAQHRFQHLIWLTFQQEEYDVGQGCRRPMTSRTSNTLPCADAPAGATVNHDQWLETLAAQLGLAQPPLAKTDTPQQARQAQLRAYLAEYPALIVIDNLESVSDYIELVRLARTLTQPSKVLIASRYSAETPDAFVLRLDELSWEASWGLLTFEAELRGISEVVSAPPRALRPIYEVVGGNPLALKLVIGQLTLLPLTEVLHRLQKARKVGERTEYELYHYLYRTTWQLLSPAARELMLTMIVFPTQGATWQELLLTSEMKQTVLLEAIKECSSCSLLNIVGWPHKIYSLHRLTYTFLMTDVLKWWA